MHIICNFCAHQSGLGKLKCSEAVYNNNAYGSHKQGALCSYDSDLSPLFKPRTAEDVNVRDLAGVTKRLEGQVDGLSQENEILKKRLVSVNE
jgi:hypothetical protein